jgi:hypothetical protein
MTATEEKRIRYWMAMQRSLRQLYPPGHSEFKTVCTDFSNPAKGLGFMAFCLSDTSRLLAELSYRNDPALQTIRADFVGVFGKGLP